jgi:hypothetical protein
MSSGRDLRPPHGSRHISQRVREAEARKLYSFLFAPSNGSALSCRQGPPPWRTGAPMFDARLYRGRSERGP